MSEIDTTSEGLSDGVNRCPACGSTDVQLRPTSGMLICLFCRHEWAGDKLEPLFEDQNDLTKLTGTHVTTGAADIDAEAEDVMTLKCSGCGSEVVVNLVSEVSAKCHWCRHILTVNQKVPNGAIPDALLPFSLTHEQAMDSIKKFADKRKFFAHKKFKEEFGPQTVVGVYMPYMVVDANATVDVTGVGEITVRTHQETDNEGKTTTTYDVDVYSVERHVDFTVDDLIIESSAERANMQAFVNTNNIINAVLPFDTKEAVKWNANYLTGYTSEKRDQDVAAIQPEFENQLLSIGRSEVQNSVRKYGRGVRWQTEKLDLEGSRWVAMYLPIWLYSYYHEVNGRGMAHYIAVNGRTGKTMGSVPVSHFRLFMAAGAAGLIAEILAIIIMIVGG